MSYFVICAVALLASTLTFYSGFGLGTLLLPAFALFVPVEHAVALTAIVHLLNSPFKLLLTRKHADWGVALRFGAPAFVMSFVGAWPLVRLASGCLAGMGWGCGAKIHCDEIVCQPTKDLSSRGTTWVRGVGSSGQNGAAARKMSTTLRQ